MNLLEARNLVFSYGKREVLKDVSISLPAGEVVAVLGPNGTGKSTLLRILIGQLRASGQVLWNGRDVRKWPRRELRARSRICRNPPSPIPTSEWLMFCEQAVRHTWAHLASSLPKMSRPLSESPPRSAYSEFLARWGTLGRPKAIGLPRQMFSAGTCRTVARRTEHIPRSTASG